MADRKRMHSVYAAIVAGPATVRTPAATTMVTKVAVFVTFPVLVLFHWIASTAHDEVSENPNAYDESVVHCPDTRSVKLCPEAGNGGVSVKATEGKTDPEASMALFWVWPRVFAMPVRTA